MLEYLCLVPNWNAPDDFKLCNDYLNEVKKKYTNYLQEYLDNYKKMPRLIQEYIDNNWLQNKDDLLSLRERLKSQQTTIGSVLA